MDELQGVTTEYEAEDLIPIFESLILCAMVRKQLSRHFIIILTCLGRFKFPSRFMVFGSVKQGKNVSLSIPRLTTRDEEET